MRIIMVLIISVNGLAAAATRGEHAADRRAWQMQSGDLRGDLAPALHTVSPHDETADEKQGRRKADDHLQDTGGRSCDCADV